MLQQAVPDKFSETGQIWGNPLYDWKNMEADGFDWWKERIAMNAKLFDVIRIDHFTGFVKNYMVPKDAEDTSVGKWMERTGKKTGGSNQFRIRWNTSDRR